MHHISAPSRQSAHRVPVFNLDVELQKLVDAEFAGLSAGLKGPGHEATKEVENVFDSVELPAAASSVVPFNAEEEAFVANASTFLTGRANADMLIEALATRALRQPDIAPVADQPAQAEGVQDA